MSRELTIGEVAARSGLSTSALRFYERLGLIQSSRTGSNHRRYPPVTLRLLAVVQAGRAAGIPLDEIRQALETLPPGKAPTQRDWERFSRRWRDELDKRIAALQALRSTLTSCIGCGCLSLRRCELFNPQDEAAELGGGAHFLLRDRDAVWAARLRRAPAPRA